MRSAEDVLRAVELCYSFYSSCANCPYVTPGGCDNAEFGSDISTYVHKSVPERVRTAIDEATGSRDYTCPSCGGDVFGEPGYPGSDACCANCGQRLNWT
jgi:hypothetical protein